MTQVMTFYRFFRVAAAEALAETVRGAAEAANLCGTVLIATEGINGTLAGTPTGLMAFETTLRAIPGLGDLPVRLSAADPDNPVFHRLKVKVKDEIVALRQPDIDPGRATGHHVDAKQWNALLAADDVVVIDTRNDYEVGVGTFPGAINPGTRSFREFPAWADANLDPQRDRRIAMFCTGGIRCEKASAYLLARGFEAVYQLDGGVLHYLETVDSDNRWRGECFVFDQRVAVTDALEQGEFVQCHACRAALDTRALESPDYVEGVSCPNCVASVSAQRRVGFAERIRQERIAAARGGRHVGATMPSRGRR